MTTTEIITDQFRTTIGEHHPELTTTGTNTTIYIYKQDHICTIDFNPDYISIYIFKDPEKYDIQIHRIDYADPEMEPKVLNLINQLS